jgi:hypothetical protein
VSLDSAAIRNQYRVWLYVAAESAAFQTAARAVFAKRRLSLALVPVYRCLTYIFPAKLL